MRKGTVVAMVIIILGAFGLMIAMQAMLKQKGLGSTCQVAQVLDGTLTEGRVSVVGIVEKVDPEAGEVYLRDLDESEVCLEGVCVRATVRVTARGDFEVGRRAVIKGTIASRQGIPYLIASEDD